MRGTYLARNFDMSGITYRGLPRTATLNQVVAEGGQHGQHSFRCPHTVYNN